MDVQGIRYIGRFDFSDPGGPQCGWSASSINLRFYGTRISATIKPWGRNYLLVLVDGKITTPSLPVMEEGTYVLAEDLTEGEHEIVIVKKTEFYLGTLQWKGFDPGEGHLLPLPVPLERKIEFIGDSITCGFGNEAENENVEYDPVYDNAYASYASIAARALNAEGRLISWSGFGLIRDYLGNEDNTLPANYHRITMEGTRDWDFSQWIPHMVVINLGTNDFSNGFIPERDRFVEAYKQFILRIRQHYPHVKILLTLGPLVDGEALSVSRQYIKEDVVESLRQQGHHWIYFLEYPHQKTEDGYGVSWHPSLRTHELMGNRLAQEIKSIMNWA